jgi:phosphate transport system substrate-binding protein
MKKIIPITVVFLVVTLCSFAAPGWSQMTPQTSGQVILTAAGSGVNLAITRLLAEAFSKSHPQVTINIPGSIGTRGAIKAVSDRAITFGLISRPLKEEEKELGIVAKEYARVAIIIGAHPTVPDQSITSQDLIDIFQGTKTRWGSGREIIVQAREKSDSGFLVLENNIPGFKEVYAESHKANRWTLYFTDQDANQALATTPDAIGVSDLGMITTDHLRINALKLDGAAPSPENLLNGTYRLSRNLSFIFKENDLPTEAEDFFAFVSSEAGRDILQANGYLPAK